MPRELELPSNRFEATDSINIPQIQLFHNGKMGFLVLFSTTNYIEHIESSTESSQSKRKNKAVYIDGGYN